MEKRLILAIALSILVMLSWSAIMPKAPVPQARAINQPQSQVPPRSQAQPVSIPEQNVPEPTQDTLFSVEQDKYTITFIEPQAAIKEVVFKDYNNHKFNLKHAFAILDINLVFKKQSVSQEAVVNVQNDINKRIKKAFLFSKSPYTMDLDINVQTENNNSVNVQSGISLGVLNFKIDPATAQFRNIAVGTLSNGVMRVQSLNGRKDVIIENPEFVAVRDQYFCSIVEPMSKNYFLSVKKINPQETEVSLMPTETVLKPGQNLQQKFHIYLGPQDLRIIKSIKPAWAGVVNYGFFDIISQILLRLLEFFHAIVHNWGVAIIILSVAIYLLLFPLTMKQMRSMKEMQALQPRIEELKKACKDNPQKLHKATLELYREHKVNPFGGCLPLVLQMPIFFALYQALIRSIALKGAGFLWIKDLSAPDRLFALPVSLPVVGNEFNLLPILMAIAMFVQQKTSMSASNSEYAEQQKIMLIVMPVLFGLIFYHMPAGLVLYWFVNSLLMMMNQLKMQQAK